MKIGVTFPQIELAGNNDNLIDFASQADKAQFNHLTLYDHVLGAEHEGRKPRLVGPYTEKDPFHDPMMAFSYVAAITEKIELHTGIIILPQRQTALVARQAADLDIFSKGRLRFGIGTGWNHVEYDALGEDFSTRGAKMDSQVPLLRQLWKGDVLDTKDPFHIVERACLNPVSKREIPIYMGGFSKPAYKRAARLGDGFLFGGRLESSGGALGVLESLELTKGYLKEQNRSEADFGKDYLAVTNKTVDQLADAAKRWQEAGGTHVTLVSTGKGFTSTQQHMDFFLQVREKIQG